MDESAGQDASGGSITISGGFVRAYGGNNAAGIGSGEETSAARFTPTFQQPVVEEFLFFYLDNMHFLNYLCK